MRALMIAAAVLALSLAGEASAQGRYSSSRGYVSSSSSTPFLYRGYNPGHIFGNSVRRVVWGPSLSPGR